MIPGRYDIQCPRGGTLDVSISIELDDGSDVDFDNDYTSYRLEVRPSWDKLPNAQAPEPLLELTSAAGQLVASGTTLTITDTAANTLAYDFNDAEYELEMINGAVIDKALYGKFKVGQDI